MKSLDTRRQPSQSVSMHRALLDMSFVALAVFALRTLLWYRSIRPFYFPLEDEFALLARSARMFHPDARAWFTIGFRDAFTPYPGWGLSSTDFIRPVVNAGFFLNSTVFGSHWSYYLLLNYVAMALVCGICVFLAERVLHLPRWMACTAGLLIAVVPAFGSYAATYATFMSDPLGGALALGGLAFFLSGYDAVAALLFLLGVFTKETAFYAPPAAVAILWLLPSRSGVAIAPRQKLKTTALLLSPLVLFELVYKLAFRGAGKVYVMEDVPLRERWSGLLSWPFSYSAPVPHLRGAPEFGMLLCGLFWAGIALGAVFWWRRRKNASGLFEERSLETVLFLLVASLAVPVSLDLQPRFGVSANALTLLALLALLRSSRHGLPRVVLSAMLGFLVFVSVSTQIWLYGAGVTGAREYWRLSREYITLLHDHPDTPVFVVDDMSSAFVNPGLVNEFSGHRAADVRVNSLNMDLLYRVCEPGALEISRISPDVLTFTFPPTGCATSVVLSPNQRLLTESGGRPTRVTMAGTVAYVFRKPTRPDGAYDAIAPLQSVTIHCADPTACHVLLFDRMTRHYRWV